VQREHNVDQKRIFATGLSNGGIMTHRVGCELSGVFAAIAPVA
jgi:polyhydroxybutyrate depolymerase